MKHIKIIADPYDKHIDFFIHSKVSEVNKKLIKLYDLNEGFEFGDKEADGGFLIITMDNGEIRYVVWVKSRELSLITHEIYHLVTRILTDVGIPINPSTDEAGAYLMANLTCKVMNELKRKCQK